MSLMLWTMEYPHIVSTYCIENSLVDSSCAFMYIFMMFERKCYIVMLWYVDQIYSKMDNFIVDDGVERERGMCVSFRIDGAL